MLLYDPRGKAVEQYRTRAADLAAMAELARDDGSVHLAQFMEAASYRLRLCAQSEIDDRTPAGLAQRDSGVGL